MEFFNLGNGQGLIGALGSLAYNFQDYTFELLSYRKKSNFGKKRFLEKENIKSIQKEFQNDVFNCYDFQNDRILISPHGPDPVFYGIRGENISKLFQASKKIESYESLQGFMVFKSNQGTNDHLKNQLDLENFRPYNSGTLVGTVSKNPVINKGGHVQFSVVSNNHEINCAVYRPTGISNISSRLRIGDIVKLGGGVRKSSKNNPRVLNVEFFQVLKLAKITKKTNPFCNLCKKRMKSKGVGQGFQCQICGRKNYQKNEKIIKRNLEKKLYIPLLSAQRHLTKPLSRTKLTKKSTKFNDSLPWFLLN